MSANSKLTVHLILQLPLPTFHFSYTSILLIYKIIILIMSYTYIHSIYRCYTKTYQLNSVVKYVAVSSSTYTSYTTSCGLWGGWRCTRYRYRYSVHNTNMLLT